MRGYLAILLETSDQSLDFVALSVGSFVEVGLKRLILAGWDHRLDRALPEATTRGWAGVASVPGRSAWHRPFVHQRVQGELLVALAARQHRRDRFAAAFGTQMQLGREPALATPECIPDAFDRHLTCLIHEGSGSVVASVA